jgi:AraC-like DNA-binding protein
MKAITQKLKDKEPMVGNLGRNFVRDGVVLLMDWSVLDRSRVELHQPYIDAEGRVLCLQEGSAKYLVNMKELELRPNQVLVIPENSLVELEEIGDGFAVQGFSFHRLPMASLFTQGTVVTPDDASWQRLGNYLELMSQVVHSGSFQLATYEYLQMAMLTDLSTLQGNATSASPASRGEIIFEQFLNLLGSQASIQRSINYYASQLCITPGHLSAVVRRQSGQSVMQWVNRRFAMQAKLLLRHSDRTVADIAFDLRFENASFFTRFFRRETGLSPSEYRKATS